jgi:hypothetical protein
MTDTEMYRIASEEANERLFFQVLHDSQCQTFIQYLDKRKIPYIRWSESQPLPEEACLVLTTNDTHVAYYDGEYLWNPNDDRYLGDHLLEDGLDGFPSLRGFRDYGKGIEESHNSETTTKIGETGEEEGGQCFLLSLGYRTILGSNAKSNRTKLLKMTTRQVVGRKIS